MLLEILLLLAPYIKARSFIDNIQTKTLNKTKPRWIETSTIQ